MKSPGDLAESVAVDYLEKYEDGLTEEELALDQAGPMVQGQKKGLFTKIEFRWRPSDRKLLESIRAAVDSSFATMFADAFAVIDEFYASVRVPEQSGGVVKLDSDNRPVWKKHPNGKFVEDYDLLATKDLERLIFDLQKAKFALSEQQSQLLAEAILAKHAEDDHRNEAWLEILDGTQGDRNAKVSRESLPDKYHAYFRYTLYLRSQTFTREVDNFLRLLEKLRYWRSREGSNG